MGILDVFKKKENSGDPMDPNNMGMLQRMAMKKLEKMSPEEREKLMKKVMTPENIQKNKADILKTLEQMKKAGQMNDHQVFEAKKRLGLL
jgi:NAD+--asparagine ADP-ribosyltransferase